MPNSNYDVIIIGAGLAGALVARYLADGGMRVVVLEAKPAPGGTAHSSAILSLLGTPEPYHTLETRWGHSSALEIWDHSRENLYHLEQILSELGQKCRITGSIRPTAIRDEVKIWQNSATLLQEYGYDIELETASVYQYRAMILTFDDIVFNSKALIEGLLTHPGIMVEYDCEVEAIKVRDTGEHAVWGYKRYIWGDRVVIANGIHATRFEHTLNRFIKPRIIHSIETLDVPALAHPMILHHGNVNIIPTTDTWTITGWGTDIQQVLQLMINTAEKLCPEARVKTRQTMWVATSQDGLPLIGSLPNSQNMYAINGLGPFGASWVFVAAHQLAALILENKRPRLLDITRLSGL
ncbi:MAG: FAD-binding oxidoreductase [Anaerolineae bacterium]|nr:FAD-binding oxidoreductase [Anaerolineae bacterium]